MGLAYKEEFLRDLQFLRCFSDHTISAYKRDLSLYEDFLRSRKASDKFKGFYEFLTKKGLSARSQARIISSLRAYFHFLESREVLNDKTRKNLKFPKFQAGLPKLISFKEFRKLWLASEGGNSFLTSRNRLVLSLLYGLGCRVSELAGLNVKDFNETGAWIRVTGKGRRQRVLPLSKELQSALIKYLEKARPSIIKSKTSSLICNNRGKRPSRVDIWRWLRLWSLKAGFKEIKNPHSFRHGCATALLERGADLISIQKLLGHINVQTTQVYTAVTSKHLKDTIQKYHPLSYPGNAKSK